MSTVEATTRVLHFKVGRSLSAVRMETPHLAATVVLDQGADILELIHKPSGIDVLWKVPYPVREPGIGSAPTGDSFLQWIHHYRGGWQTILPNYGAAVSFRGTVLDFHGEAARRPWQLDSENSRENVEIEVSTQLASLPLSVRRKIGLSGDGPKLTVIETVTNVSSNPVDCMWGHHPVFGAPLLAPESRIFTGARLIHTDDSYDPTSNDLPLGEIFEWPFVTSKKGHRVDLSRVPAVGSGFSRLVFLKDWEQPWCAISNPAIPLGLAIRWNDDLMKYMCLWQETGGIRDFPHFGKAYTTAMEPSTSLFGHGLLAAIENHNQLTLQAGESRTLHLTAVLFDDPRTLSGMGSSGELEFTA